VFDKWIKEQLIKLKIKRLMIINKTGKESFRQKLFTAKEQDSFNPPEISAIFNLLILQNVCLNNHS
jgi:hypothetical protein